MPSQEASDVLALLNTAFRDAGWLVEMSIARTVHGSQICIAGLPLENAEEMALTIQAGLEARVIRQ